MKPAAEAPKTDLFGSPTEKVEPPVVKPEEKKGDEGKKPEFDVATHPTVVEMNKKIEDMSGNLSKQREMIEARDKKIAELEGKKTVEEAEKEFEPPHKEIKRSKDLTEDERDEKTKGELELMDKLADMQERENKDALEKHKAKAKTDAEKATADAAKAVETDPKAILEAEITALAGGDKERERELKEAAKLTSFDGLKSKEEIAARLKLGAEKFIPNWTPPKEQASGGAPAAVKDTKSGKNGGVDVDSIVREARSGSAGDYAL